MRPDHEKRFEHRHRKSALGANRSPSASIVANNRVVFNIKGNDYRLIVAIAYRMQYVYVKFVGTHADYDKIDVTTVDQFKGV